jgi:hypothetical protein
VIFNYNPFCLTVLQVHLITKNIYETLKGDFNNLHHVIATIICINNKLAFYVSLTIFWALFNVYFKKDSIHYFKMYSTDKVTLIKRFKITWMINAFIFTTQFFKLLLNNEPFNDSQDADSMFKLLLLISIYQNHVLLNKETPEAHQVFQEFFKSSQKDREKLKNWLINVKTLIEVNNPLGKSNQSADVLMVSTRKEDLKIERKNEEKLGISSSRYIYVRVRENVEHNFSCVTQLDVNGGAVMREKKICKRRRCLQKKVNELERISEKTSRYQNFLKCLLNLYGCKIE